MVDCTVLISSIEADWIFKSIFHQRSRLPVYTCRWAVGTCLLGMVKVQVVVVIVAVVEWSEL